MNHANCLEWLRSVHVGAQQVSHHMMRNLVLMSTLAVGDTAAQGRVLWYHCLVVDRGLPGLADFAIKG